VRLDPLSDGVNGGSPAVDAGGRHLW